MGNSFLLIVVGLLIFYLVISNKWQCVEGAFACMLGKTNSPTNTTAPTAPAPTSTPQLIKPPTPQTLVSYANILNDIGGFGI